MAILSGYLIAALIALPLTVVMVRKVRRGINLPLGTKVPAKPRRAIFGAFTFMLAPLVFFPMTIYLDLQGRNFPGGEIPFLEDTGINAVKGYHRGTANFDVMPLKPGGQPLKWITELENDGKWDDEISIAHGTSASDPVLVEGVVMIPNDPSLIGRRITGTLRASIVYPQFVPGGFTNSTIEKELHLAFDVRNPTATDKAIYAAESGWPWILFLAGLAVLVLGGAWGTLEEALKEIAKNNG
jgi:hypothetical protein